MASDAQSYSALNKPQYDMGCDFIGALSLSKGDKVLDMGCGTGELTKFIADIVGADGEVTGVDPDEARIKFAQDQFKDVQNVKFLVGNSVTGFPHDNDQYYDLHLSNHAFHWIKGDEKSVYLKKAYQCLKPGGRVAILCPMKQEVKVDSKFFDATEYLTEEEHRDQIQSLGLFTDLVLEKIDHVAHFATVDEFGAWLTASTQGSAKLEDLEPETLKKVLEKFTETAADGSLTLHMRNFARITARK